MRALGGGGDAALRNRVLQISLARKFVERRKRRKRRKAMQATVANKSVCDGAEREKVANG